MLSGQYSKFGGVCLADQVQKTSLKNTLVQLENTVNNVNSNDSGYWTSAYESYICSDTAKTGHMKKIILRTNTLLEQDDPSHHILFMFKSYNTECTENDYASKSRTDNSKTIVLCKAYNNLHVTNNDQFGISKLQTLAGYVTAIAIDGLHDNGELREIANTPLSKEECKNRASVCSSEADFSQGFCLSYFLQEVDLQNKVVGAASIEFQNE